METVLHRALSDRRQKTLERWETLLRIERVNTPLANPDALVHLFNWTLEEVFSRIHRAHEGVSSGARDYPPSDASGVSCECGRNPFVAYFKAAKQALMEALILEQAETPLLDPIDRDLAMAELRQVIDAIGQNEIAAFCALCTHRAKTASLQVGREQGFWGDQV